MAILHWKQGLLCDLKKKKKSQSHVLLTIEVALYIRQDKDSPGCNCCSPSRIETVILNYTTEDEKERPCI